MRSAALLIFTSRASNSQGIALSNYIKDLLSWLSLHFWKTHELNVALFILSWDDFSSCIQQVKQLSTIYFEIRELNGESFLWVIYHMKHLICCQNIYAWWFLVTNHSVGFSRAGLSVCKTRHLSSLKCKVNQTQNAVLKNSLICNTLIICFIKLKGMLFCVLFHIEFEFILSYNHCVAIDYTYYILVAFFEFFLVDRSFSNNNFYFRYFLLSLYFHYIIKLIILLFCTFKIFRIIISN